MKSNDNLHLNLIIGITLYGVTNLNIECKKLEYSVKLKIIANKFMIVEQSLSFSPFCFKKMLINKLQEYILDFTDNKV